MFDFRRITLFCLEKRLSKHKIATFSKYLGRAMASLVPPGYAYDNHYKYSEDIGVLELWVIYCKKVQNLTAKNTAGHVAMLFTEYICVVVYLVHQNCLGTMGVRRGGQKIGIKKQKFLENVKSAV